MNKCRRDRPPVRASLVRGSGLARTPPGFPSRAPMRERISADGMRDGFSHQRQTGRQRDGFTHQRILALATYSCMSDISRQRRARVDWVCRSSRSAGHLIEDGRLVFLIDVLVPLFLFTLSRSPRSYGSTSSARSRSAKAPRRPAAGLSIASQLSTPRPSLIPAGARPFQPRCLRLRCHACPHRIFKLWSPNSSNAAGCAACASRLIRCSKSAKSPTAP